MTEYKYHSRNRIAIRYYLSIITILVFLLFNSCASNQQNDPEYFTNVKGEKIPLIRMDLVEDSATTVGLSSLFDDITIVPLETREECMIMNWTTGFTDNTFILSTQVGIGSPCRILEFDLDGNFIKQYGKGGQGPGEHTGYGVEPITYYPDDQVLLIEFVGNGDENQLFTMDGKFLKEIKKPKGVFRSLTRLRSGINMSWGSIAGRPTYLRDSVQLILYNDKQEILKSYPRTLYPPENVSGFTPYGRAYLYPFKDSYRLFSQGSDTLFEVHESELKPVAVFNFSDKQSQYNSIVSLQSEEGRYGIKIVRETDQFLFMEKSVVRKLNMREYRPGQWGGSRSVDEFLILYDKKEGQSYNLRFTDDLLGLFPEDLMKEIGTIFSWDPLGQVYFLFQALDILEWSENALEKETLPSGAREKILELQSKITEDSNPVLFIMKERKKYEI